ncbi:MAG: hypothetical protein ACOC2L_05110 [Candidatus Sumerlaeota bacterium]
MSPNTSLKAQLRDAQTLVENYVGFDSPADRKATDEAVRKKLNAAVSDLFLHVVSLEHYLARSGMDELRTLAAGQVQKFQDLLDKIQSSPYAFSPFFTYDQVDESAQSLVMEKDLALLRTLDRVMELLGVTLRPESDFQSILETTEVLAEDMDKELEARINAIMEYS